MKKLTERAAWLLLAKACEKAAASRWDALPSPYECFGLCAAVQTLSNRASISPQTHAAMNNKISAAMRRAHRSAYLFATTWRGHFQRAKFCRKQAALLKRKKVRA